MAVKTTEQRFNGAFRSLLRDDGVRYNAGKFLFAAACGGAALYVGQKTGLSIDVRNMPKTVGCILDSYVIARSAVGMARAAYGVAGKANELRKLNDNKEWVMEGVRRSGILTPIEPRSKDL